MGVPRLFKWVSQKYPKNIYDVSIGKRMNWLDYPIINRGKDVDNLYLDAVGVLHMMAARVFKYGDHALKEDEKDEFEGLTEKEKTNKVYEFSMDYIISIIHLVKPKFLTYLSLDGVAPLAKQGQQRQRRFLAAKGRAESKQIFDSNIITAGSRFTYNFSLYAKYRLIGCVDSDNIFKSMRVIFSNSNVPGEGEHKIMEYIRFISNNNGKQVAVKGRHVLYGPDGDLLMLGLCTHCEDFWILRENFFDSSKFNLVDLGTIRQNIFKELTQDVSFVMEGRQCNIKDVIHDFVLICFFLGNDFLPKLQMVDLLEHGIETLLSNYKKIKKERTVTSEWSLTKDGVIQPRNFQHYINSIAGLEKHFLIKQIFIKPENSKFLNNTLLSALEEGTENLNFQKYYKAYTEKKLLNNVEGAIEQYFQGFDWILRYYTKGCPDWRWIYEFHYAPLMSMLTSPLANTKIKENNWPLDPLGTKPVTPYRQMMCVIPPLSKAIVNEKIRHIYTDSRIAKYYPTVFDTDFEGKRQDWQGVAILPVIDQKDMDKVYAELEDIDSTENKIDKPIMLRHDEKSSLTLKSKYGILESCEVQLKKLDFSNP